MTCGHPCGVVCHTGTCAEPSACRKKRTSRCPCKRRKEVGLCKDIPPALPCDEQCAALQAEKEAEQRAIAEKKAQEELAANRREVEQYEASLQKKKRKPRRQVVVEEATEHWLLTLLFQYRLTVAVGVAFAALILVYYMS